MVKGSEASSHYITQQQTILIPLLEYFAPSEDGQENPRLDIIRNIVVKEAEENNKKPGKRQSRKNKQQDNLEEPKLGLELEPEPGPRPDVSSSSSPSPDSTTTVTTSPELADTTTTITPPKKRNQVSLRIIDWFTTNFAKMHCTQYQLQPGGELFVVHESYQEYLDSFSKKWFDPFNRKGEGKVWVPYKKGYQFDTTIGQLNFFKWAIEHNIPQYIEAHYDEIRADMKLRYCIMTSKKKKEQKQLSATTSATTTSTYSTSLSSVTTSSSDSSDSLSALPLQQTQQSLLITPRRKRQELSTNIAMRTLRRDRVNVTIRLAQHPST